IEKFKGIIPIFGVCLGHQSIAHAFGGDIVKTGRIMHGKTSQLHHDGTGMFREIPAGTEVMNYHSLDVDRAAMPEVFEVRAENAKGEVMDITQSDLCIEGLQFHPECIGSADGSKLLENVLESIKVQK